MPQRSTMAAVQPSRHKEFITALYKNLPKAVEVNKKRDKMSGRGRGNEGSKYKMKYNVSALWIEDMNID